MFGLGIPVLAGAASTVIFVASYLPMLVKAARSRDLSPRRRDSAPAVITTTGAPTFSAGPDCQAGWRASWSRGTRSDIRRSSGVSGPVSCNGLSIR